MKLVTAAQMREIDRLAIEQRGIDAYSLMEAAGRVVAEDLCEHFEPASVAVLCGRGNNGGDGFVAARHLARAGWNVQVLFVEVPAATAGPAYRAWEELPREINRANVDEIADLTGYLSDFTVAVDALLGTGTKGIPRAPYDQLIRDLNAARLPVFAVDIPSGLDPDSGEGDNVVHAFRTITMGLPKIGMVTARGPQFCGTTRVAPLHFPADLLDGVETYFHTLTMREAAQLLPARPLDGHKGTFGLLLIAAGSEPMPGAAILAGIGAMRGGCGLVRMHVPAAIRAHVINHLPEAILSTEPAGERCLEPVGGTGWMVLLERVRALCIGPGVGKDRRTRDFLREALEKVELPTVLDADALNLLAENEELRARLAPRHVLTPHPGELGALLHLTIADIQKDRWSAAREAASRFRATIVLKGHGTLVAEPDGTMTHVGPGNSAWARGGAGDILTGIIGSLLAQGCGGPNAAKLGAFVHGLAADLYLREHSARGALTRDVAAFLPLAFRQLEAQLKPI